MPIISRTVSVLAPSCLIPLPKRSFATAPVPYTGHTRALTISYHCMSCCFAYTRNTSPLQTTALFRRTSPCPPLCAGALWPMPAWVWRDVRSVFFFFSPGNFDQTCAVKETCLSRHVSPSTAMASCTSTSDPTATHKPGRHAPAASTVEPSHEPLTRRTRHRAAAHQPRRDVWPANRRSLHGYGPVSRDCRNFL